MAIGVSGPQLRSGQRQVRPPPGPAVAGRPISARGLTPRFLPRPVDLPFAAQPRSPGSGGCAGQAEGAEADGRWRGRRRSQRGPSCQWAKPARGQLAVAVCLGRSPRVGPAPAWKSLPALPACGLIRWRRSHHRTRPGRPVEHTAITVASPPARAHPPPADWDTKQLSPARLPSNWEVAGQPAGRALRATAA